MMIFVSGVHGVGKTTLCSSYVSTQNKDWKHFSAGELIKREMSTLAPSPKLLNDVKFNQKLLLQALAKKNLNYKKVLLDGHFVLCTENDSIVPISANVFKKLHLSGVILIEADPELIVARLRNRSGVKYDIKKVSTLLKAEREEAEKVCHGLHIPLHVVFKPTIKDFSTIVATFG